MKPVPTEGAVSSSLAGVGRRAAEVEVDPTTLRVIGGALDAIAKEMAQVLYRMAYSSIIRESEDLGAGIFDVSGREFCESDSTPMHIGSIPAYIRGVNRRLEGSYEPGDVVLHNHPYHGASHSPDYCVLVPIFWQGEHLGFAGCTGHVLDIGGAFPGLSLDVVDVWAEGKLIDSAKIYAAGVRNDHLFQHILDNVRTPDMNRGDIEAMIACCRLGERRFTELLERFGVETVLSAVEKWMDYSERMLRAEIEQVPDGVYRAPDGWLDDDGKNYGKPLKVALAVEVSGSDITIDLTGSAPQVETAFNVPFEGSVLPTCNFAVRTLFLDEATNQDFIPQNDGAFRAVRARAPLGTIFNPRFPASNFARFSQINRIPDLINQALAEVMPERIVAGCSAAVQSLAYSGVLDDDGQYWVYIEVNEGSYGGRCGKDGLDAVDCLMANTRNNPIEELELRQPMLCERYELRDDPPAAGRWRGGIGSVRRWRFLTKTYVGSEGDRRSDPPRGLFGGEDGRSGSIRRNPDGPAEESWPSKFTNSSCDPGDVLEISLPCGAGYGDPLERDPAAVRDDVLDELLSAAEARAVYGVALDPDSLEVDERATAELRGQRGDRE
ncbi:MAG: hydantoinase B/oxoprolinase family protein [Actinobacteria bacterium]|nr:hydantoinase B/oxoprolinase family protein [Actinomycetota bacterium]